MKGWGRTSKRILQSLFNICGTRKCKETLILILAIIDNLKHLDNLVDDIVLDDRRVYQRTLKCGVKYLLCKEENLKKKNAR